MANENKTLSYTKQPFDECGKILASLDKSKISKLIMNLENPYIMSLIIKSKMKSLRKK